MSKSVILAPWEIAARLSLFRSVSNWAIVTIPSENIDELIDELYASLAEFMGADLVVRTAPIHTGKAFEESSKENSDKILLAQVSQEIDASFWPYVEVARSRLVRSEQIIILAREAEVKRIFIEAPNLASWIGGSVWKIGAEEGLTDELRKNRIATLEKRYGFNGAELVRRVTAKQIDLDAHLAEWLILINRADLLKD